MWRGLLAGLLTQLLLPAAVHIYPSLPSGAQPNCVQVDSAGNIFVGGVVKGDAFVAKISSDGSSILYWTVFGGADTDNVQALALGSDGSAYVTGNTLSTDFPTTPGAMQPAAGSKQQSFAAKLDASGKVRYATYFGGSALMSGGGITVDDSGNAYITGLIGGSAAGFPVTPGSVAGYAGNTGFYPQTGFILKLNPSGSTALISILGFGGAQVALDREGNIFAAGALTGPVPTTPNAFQSSTEHEICSTSFLFGPFPCRHQHIAKIDPSGRQLIFGTYLSGYFGAIPAAMVLDDDGNVIVAGVTSSADYPTTKHAYQPQYLFDPNLSFQPTANTTPPVNAGFVSKLNASGTGLIWSTFFSGSRTAPSYTLQDGDIISGMGVDSGGNILIAGSAKSSDLPGLWGTPVASRPKGGQQQPTAGFVARLSSDGVTLSPTELLPVVVNGPFSNTLAVRNDGSAIVVPQLAAVSLSDPPRVASITDTDNTRLVRVAPGQLLTLWGTKIAPVQVTFDGIAAPILYAGGDQVNLQVPFEIDGRTEVTMQVTGQFADPPFSESFIMGVIARQPSLLISAANFAGPLFGVSGCTPGVRCIQPLALNEDGTANDSDHPAPSGSTVTVFLNAVGNTSPALATGSISAELTELSPGVTIPCCYVLPVQVVSTETIPQNSTTIVQVRIRVSSTSSMISVPLGVRDSSTAIIRGVSALIWTTPGK